MMTAFLVLALGARTAAAADVYTAPADDGQKMVTELVWRLTLQDSTTNAWSLASSAVEAVRDARAGVAPGSADRATLDRLAAAYDKTLVSSLWDLRECIRYTMSAIDTVERGMGAIDTNARHGRASSPRDPADPRFDPMGPPEPVEFAATDAMRDAARDLASKAQRALQGGAAELAALKAEGAAPGVRMARDMMLAAFEASASVAGEFADLDGPQGLVHAEIAAAADYMAAANKALSPVPDERRKAVAALNAGAREFVAIEFRLGRNAGEARYLDYYVRQLGPLTAAVP